MFEKKNLRKYKKSNLKKYKDKIDTGDIRVNYFVEYEINRCVDLLKNKMVEYEPIAVMDAIDFFEANFRWSNGSPMRFTLFQKVFFELKYGFFINHMKTMQDGNGDEYLEKVRELFFDEVYLEMGRKMGKTEMEAVDPLFRLTLLGVPGEEYFNASDTTKQADILMKALKIMVSGSKYADMFKFIESYPKKCTYIPENIVFNVIPATFERFQSIKGASITIDEIHLFTKNPTQDAITSQSSSKNPQITYITTAGKLRNGLYDEFEKIHIENMKSNYKDSRLLVLKYVLTDVDEIADPDNWIKALPNLGVTYSKENVAKKIQKAQTDSVARLALLTTVFGIKQNDVFSYFSEKHTWRRKLPDNVFKKFNNGYCVLGVDLATSYDFSSVCYMTYHNGKYYVKMRNIKPKSADEKMALDKQELYQKFVDNGSLLESDGYTIDNKKLAENVVSELEKEGIIPLVVGYDNYFAREFMEVIKRRFGQNIGDEVRQGAMTMSEPLKKLHSDFENGNIIFDCPMLAKAIEHVTVQIGKNSEIRPLKGNRDNKIDPFMAMFDAYIAMQRTGLVKYETYFFDREDEEEIICEVLND